MKKKIFSLKSIAILGFVLTLSSCSDECAECHLTAEIEGSEYEIMELGEYCEDELHNIEENGYTLQDTLYLDADGDSLPSAITPNSATEVHCGEEHDH